MRKITSLAALAAAGFSLSVSAQVSVNGTRDAAYGSAIAVQQTGTQFGNSNQGQVGSANGSELNAAYARVENNTLFLMLTGNLESNFNKLELFFNTVAGGQNQLRGDNADVDFNGLNRMGAGESGPGLRFDAGFDADSYIAFGGNGTDIFANHATLPTGGAGVGTYLGQTTYGSDGTLTGGNSLGIRLTINNSNTAGVGSLGDANEAAGADAVSTGIELAIPLSLLGSPTGAFDVVAFVNAPGHDFASNQVLGAAPLGTGNLGDPRNVNFANIAGNQFFTVVPEPGTLGLAAVGALGLVRRRRR